MWSALRRAVVDFVWPASCPRCERESVDAGLCAGCRAAMVRRTEDEVWQEVDGVGGVAAVLRYADPARGLLLAAKYGGDPHPLVGLGELLAAEMPGWGELGCPDCVVPVAPSRTRMRERGFDQALELARPVAARLGVPLLPRLLRRTRHRPPQVSLDGAARRRNLAGAFRAKGCAGRAVLLVDDVTTTGSTLRECATALRGAGARRVTALCLFRAPP